MWRLLVLRLPRLGKRELILVLFVLLFGLCLFRYRFPLPLGVWEGLRLWVWHSLDLSLTFFYPILIHFTPNCMIFSDLLRSRKADLTWLFTSDTLFTDLAFPFNYSSNNFCKKGASGSKTLITRTKIAECVVLHLFMNIHLTCRFSHVSETMVKRYSVF